jgi:hypothetical protein
MTIRILATGDVYDRARHWGFTGWCRVWVDAKNGRYGYLHFKPSEYVIVTPDF